MDELLKEKRYKELVKENQRLQEKVSSFQFQIDQLQRLLFGAKRERFVAENSPYQTSLPFDVPEEEQIEEKQEEITYTRKQNTKKHQGRVALPDHLPVEEIHLEPKQNTTGLKCIGKEVTDQLELIPAKLFIKRYIRPRYIKQTDSETETHQGIIAQLPSFPIEKSIAASGLLAQIMIDKFVDHLPIYRQIERFKRDGVKIASSTINGWQEAVCNLLEPLYDTLQHRVLSQGYLQVDETTIQVLDKQKKGKTHRGYYWVYHSPIEKTVFFDYQQGRSRQGPAKLLAQFKGYLQTDGYKVYDSFDLDPEITQLNCFAHARRGFEKALDFNPQQAEHAMDLFQKIYAIERQAREQELSHLQRHELRLEKALPILNELGKWISENYSKVLPKSPIGQAINYCIPRWNKFLAYLKDGALEIDNNLVENSIRPVALGRKNYLFAGSEKGAKRAAMMYSFLGTCKKNEVNPFLWLKKVLEVIPEHSVLKLDELLPQNCNL